MAQTITPIWPPNPADDHYLSHSPKVDWAWQFLRRNTAYQRAASGRQTGMIKVGTIGSGIPVFRLHKHEEAAQDWALYSFR